MAEAGFLLPNGKIIHRYEVRRGKERGSGFWSEQDFGRRRIFRLLPTLFRFCLFQSQRKRLMPLSFSSRCLRQNLREIRPTEQGFRIETLPFSQVDIHEAPVTSIVMPVR